ncbi:Aminotransferase-like, plant mobile domain [Sesbania bispinosa]|nr:Aminotransferase-like, plant mobile domain [Sesbania bispinosa]
MARTRGGRSDQGRESSSQPMDRVRPTALARQRRSRQQVQETQEDVVPDQAQQEVLAPDQAHQEDPVAVQVDVQADVAAPVQLDIYGGSGNLEGGFTWEEVDGITTHGGLLSAFAERWNRDTCSFHLPVGEMTISLDDVSNLLHFPVTGRLFSLPAMGKEEANMMLVSLLRVSHQYAFAETEVTRGAYVRLRWLRDLYENSVQQGNPYVAA